MFLNFCEISTFLAKALLIFKHLAAKKTLLCNKHADILGFHN